MGSVFIAGLSAACVLACAALVATPSFAVLDAQSSRGRVRTLDGLRGLLALAVFLHHGLIYQRYLQTGEWVGIPGLCNLLGTSGVAMFFMITGYLFWDRMVSRRGRANWLGFFVGRAFRIGPVFLLASAGAIGATLALTWRHMAAPADLFWQIAPYLSLGALHAGSVNGYPTSLLLVGVIHTLQFEWVFYAALPLLAVAARRGPWHFGPPLLLIAAGLVAMPHTPAWTEARIAAASALLFGLGMMTASLQAAGVARRIPAGFGSVATVLVLLLLATQASDAYSAPAMLALGLAFFFVASGSSLFGLLTTRPLLRLGEISYGIYLLQGLVFAAVLRPGPLRGWAAASPAIHAAAVVGSALLLVLAATGAHLWLERPGIRLGHALAARLAARRPFIVLAPEGLEPR